MKTLKPSEPETGQPFDNFKRLAKGLMAVPKKELDAKIAEHEKEKRKQQKRASPLKE